MESAVTQASERFSAAHPASDDEHADASTSSLGVLMRRHVAETFGTFLLVWVDCGGAIIGHRWPGEVTSAGRAAATGLLVMGVIMGYGDVSGAHLNPAVTLGFALRGVFPWRRVFTYVLAQLAGGLAAALALAALFGPDARHAVCEPKAPLGTAFVFEVVLTATLVCVTLGTATKHRLLGPNAAVASGGTVALAALFARPISGSSMNPVRSFAPALATRHFDDVWVYVAAPFLGAAIAVAFVSVLHSRRHAEEREASSGEPK
jgi:aquaporin Z